MYNGLFTVLYHVVTVRETDISLLHKIELYINYPGVIKGEEPETTEIHKTDGQGRL